MQVYALSSHYKFYALVVVHAQEDPSFVVQLNFQFLHYVLILEFLEFFHELFVVFVHLRVRVVHLPLFKHQQETGVENVPPLVSLG